MKPKIKSSEKIHDLQLKELELLKLELKLVEGLPHLHGWKWYSWAREVFESLNREVFLTAANQVSKSSTAVRKNIEWATNADLWKKAWPHLPLGQKPNQFWYFYPTQEVATIEFETKWIPQFLPKGEFKNHPMYGWTDHYEKGMIKSVAFNSGVTIYFKTYKQNVTDLQTGTVYMITLDEECPVHLLPELQARLNSSDGFLLAVFTATLGQLYWERTMEPKSTKDELHPDALKKRVSVYDCMVYEDGSPSHWTPAKIDRAVKRCATDAEIQRRIYGRFVKSEGLRYEGFDRKRNVVAPHPLPQHWHIYSGVDPGSGGSNHPAAIVFVAVSPDFKNGRVFRGWRGDGVQTASLDILKKYRELRGSLKPTQQMYDFASREFFLVSSKQGESFTPADKDREKNIGLLNTLFKSGMLKIQDGDNELEKLIGEICSLSVDAKKSDRGVIDDLCDALMYAIGGVPWDFDYISMSDENNVLAERPDAIIQTGDEIRRSHMIGVNNPDETSDGDIESEIDFWNDMLGS